MISNVDNSAHKAARDFIAQEGWSNLVLCGNVCIEKKSLYGSINIVEKNSTCIFFIHSILIFIIL